SDDNALYDHTLTVWSPSTPSNACSRLETDQNTGTCHLLELMAFKSTRTRTHQQVVSEFEEMGGTTSTHGSRDQMLY
ncbi:unnamed protein product, partial [Scytosiphon promiscuus]